MNARSDATDFDGLLNEAEAAQLLKISVRTLQAWRIRGGGPAFVRAGRRAIRYRRRDLVAWMDLNTIKPGQQ